jgi:hypothetical protein
MTVEIRALWQEALREEEASRTSRVVKGFSVLDPHAPRSRVTMMVKAKEQMRRTPSIAHRPLL